MSEAAVHTQKQAVRKQARTNRGQQENKDELSRRIVGAFMSLPEYALAETVLFYVDVRSEVRTRFDLPFALTSGKTLVVPWCNDAGELELFQLRDMNELAVGMYGILEPQKKLREQSQRRISIEAIDLAMVPGVAFDFQGARLGHGKGYYDKLLRDARPDTSLVGLAFECQVFERIPTADHDVLMDQIVTEQRVYERRQSREMW